jgi:hypothetical protein
MYSIIFLSFVYVAFVIEIHCLLFPEAAMVVIIW